MPAEDEVLPAAATQALPLPDEAPAADAGAEADAALPEAPRWNALEEGLEYAEFSLQSEAGQQASLTVLRIDPELFDFRLYASAAHKHPALTLGQWADSHDLVAAINASMYLPDGVTSTGYRTTTSTTSAWSAASAPSSWPVPARRACPAPTS